MTAESDGFLRAIACVEAHMRGDAEAGVLLRHEADPVELAACAVALAGAIAQLKCGGRDGALALLADIRAMRLEAEAAGEMEEP